LLTEVEYPDGTFLKFSYNVIGQRTQSVDQTGFTVNYTYDSLGRLSELTDGSGNLIVQYTYDAAGNLIQKTNGNGTYTTYTYDADGNVLSITNYAYASGPVNSFDTYTYDALGNVLTDTNQDGEWVYTYDADSQLIHAVFTPNNSDPDGLTAQDIQYVYDPAGNRISETVNGVVTTYAVNNVNEYTSSTTNGITTSYQYDAAGNLIQEASAQGTTNYTYDEENRLTGVAGPGGTWNYQYDALGNLIATTHDGQTTDYMVDPTGLGNVVEEYDTSGLIAHYTYGLGLVSRTDATGSAAYYDFDARGNTVGITGSTGTYVNQYSYLPFGETTTTSASLPNPFTFAGQVGVMQIGTNLFYMRARFYTPAEGRFLNPDPAGIGGGVNLYAYALNSSFQVFLY
jgi:RHS repeat-associated protein